MFEREPQFDTKWPTERDEHREPESYVDRWPSNYKTTMITKYNDGAYMTKVILLPICLLNYFTDSHLARRGVSATGLAKVFV